VRLASIFDASIGLLIAGDAEVGIDQDERQIDSNSVFDRPSSVGVNGHLGQPLIQPCQDLGTQGQPDLILGCPISNRYTERDRLSCLSGSQTILFISDMNIWIYMSEHDMNQTELYSQHSDCE
jgi:hypothetical protein